MGELVLHQVVRVLAAVDQVFLPLVSRVKLPDARFARLLSCAQQLIGGLEVHDRWAALLSL